MQVLMSFKRIRRELNSRREKIFVFISTHCQNARWLRQRTKLHPVLCYLLSLLENDYTGRRFAFCFNLSLRIKGWLHNIMDLELWHHLCLDWIPVSLALTVCLPPGWSPRTIKARFTAQRKCVNHSRSMQACENQRTENVFTVSFIL